MTKFPLAVLAVGLLTACNHVEVTRNRCGGEVACAKGPCDPVEVLSDRPSRPYRELGVVEVRVDRGTALKNVTLADAMPALVKEGRAMGADAIILTHEEFTSWYDKGEPASAIHDLERQESWYITEKARYVSGVAVVYTGACAPPASTGVMPRSSGGYSAPVYRGAIPPGGRVMGTEVVPGNGMTAAPTYSAPMPSGGYSAPVYRGPVPPGATVTPPMVVPGGAAAPAPVYVPPAPVYVAPSPPPAPAPELVPALVPVPPPPPAPAPMVDPDPPQVPNVDLPPVPRPPDVPVDVPPVPQPPPDMPK